ncbi:hypothetical protein [Janibacter anophelis]|uniref:hypothetical protein n=3 Tax=Janibacter anophelis TaxID=319054 RepID=UPI0039F131A3
MAFFADHPGATTSRIHAVAGDVAAPPTDEELGATVMDMLRRSGVLDASLIDQGSPTGSVMARTLGLPSHSGLEAECVNVTVSLPRDRLLVRARRSQGPGGGFVGSGLPARELDPDSPAAVVGAAVREATMEALTVSASVLRPAGSWKGAHPGGPSIPGGGVVTVRRAPEGWTVTARIGARGSESATASTSVAQAPSDASFEDLGRAVTQVLGQKDEDLRPGDEDPAGGERQVLVEADEDGLTIYPQAISGDTGIWDVPAHPDLRELPRQASLTDVGQAVSLMADEQTEWG